MSIERAQLAYSASIHPARACVSHHAYLDGTPALQTDYDTSAAKTVSR